MWQHALRVQPEHEVGCRVAEAPDDDLQAAVIGGPQQPSTASKGAQGVWPEGRPCRPSILPRARRAASRRTSPCRHARYLARSSRPAYGGHQEQSGASEADRWRLTRTVPWLVHPYHQPLHVEHAQHAQPPREVLRRGNANRMTIRWAIGWQSDEPSDGNRMATDWQSGGNRMVIGKRHRPRHLRGAVEVVLRMLKDQRELPGRAASLEHVAALDCPSRELALAREPHLAVVPAGRLRLVSGGRIMSAFLFRTPPSAISPQLRLCVQGLHIVLIQLLVRPRHLGEPALLEAREELA